eukprot:2856425-Pyramimonas_sp.AAC.2
MHVRPPLCAPAQCGEETKGAPDERAALKGQAAELESPMHHLPVCHLHNRCDSTIARYRMSNTRWAWVTTTGQFT